MKTRTYWKMGSLGLIIFCIFVWMTWYLGNTFARIVSKPKIDLSQTAPDSMKTMNIDFMQNELDFWTCQAGTFQTEENARQEKRRLELQGWEAQVISQKPWVVVIGFAHAQGELTSLQNVLKERGVKTLTKHIVIPGQNFRITGSGAAQTAQILLAIQNFLIAKPEKRGDTISQLEKEISIAWPQKLDQLQQAAAYVLKAEGTLESNSQRQAELRLFAEFQSVLEYSPKIIDSSKIRE